jgi:hypothetical protein
MCLRGFLTDQGTVIDGTIIFQLEKFIRSEKGEKIEWENHGLVTPQ